MACLPMIAYTFLERKISTGDWLWIHFKEYFSEFSGIIYREAQPSCANL